MLAPHVKTLHPVWLQLSAWLSHYKPSTQVAYVGVIQEWCRFLRVVPGTEEGAKAILEVMPVQAATFVEYQRQKRGQIPRAMRHMKQLPLFSKRRDGFHQTLANNTLAKKIAALRRAYEHLTAHGMRMGTNPFHEELIPLPNSKAGRKRDTEALPFDEVPKLIAAVKGKSGKAVRDRAILALLFGSGIRREELTNIRIADVGMSQGGTYFVKLHDTKNGEDALQAIPEWSAEYVGKLLTIRASEGATELDYLFNSYTGYGGEFSTNRPISGSGLYKLFKKYVRAAGLPDLYSPHSARATAITKLLSDDVDHREVQEFSRHKSIAMVEQYDKRRIGVDRNPGKGLRYD